MTAKITNEKPDEDPVLLDAAAVTVWNFNVSHERHVCLSDECSRDYDHVTITLTIDRECAESFMEDIMRLQTPKENNTKFMLVINSLREKDLDHACTATNENNEGVYQ